MIIKLSIEGLILPLVVSFFMSGINTILKIANLHKDMISVFLSQWMVSWLISYLCLLVIVPFSKLIVNKALNGHLK